LNDLVSRRIYAKLFAASYIDRERIRIHDFTNLVDFLAWEKLESGVIVVHSLDDNLRHNLKDLVEKLGFVLLSFDILKDNKKKDTALMTLPDEERWKKVRTEHKANKFRNDKYYWYNFIIYTKASLNSIAVTLNSFFAFGFEGGQIDLGKAQFVEKVSSLKGFSNFAKTYGKWIDKVIEYRDAVIHQKSIDIFGLRHWLIPSRPLTDIELDQLRERYDSLSSQFSKSRIEKDLALMSLSSFMKTSIVNLQTITGLLSTEILCELRRRYSEHLLSKTYYH